MRDLKSLPRPNPRSKKDARDSRGAGQIALISLLIVLSLPQFEFSPIASKLKTVAVIVNWGELENDRTDFATWELLASRRGDTAWEAD